MEPTGTDKAKGEKSANEFYDVIEEELVENSSTSEESEEDATETSKNSASSAECETTEARVPTGVDVENDTVNDVPSDSIKNVNKSPTLEIAENTDSKSVSDVKSPSVTDKPDPGVISDTAKAEEMEVDNTDAVSEIKDSDSVKDAEQRSNASNMSADDYNDLIDDSLADEMDMSDVSSSFAENESIESKTPSPRKKPKKRQPPIMIGYRKRRKVHTKKTEDDQDGKRNDSEVTSFENETSEEKSQSDESRKLSGQASPASSEENVFDSSIRSTRSARKFSGTYSEVTCADKYCWVCHKDGGHVFKCIACPRVYHPKCSTSVLEAVDDPANFHCPECSAILKADNVNTRSPVMQTVNLDQLCTLLKHIISIMKIQKDAHFFYGPVDTKEFPHYREYIVYPMDLSVLEKNCKNKMYGCTEAFLADVKWILHNSIVFNSKAAKITNVAKNIVKICKREVAEIETCAECYYNLLVRKDTWFIEVCKKPHLLLWARLKGFPPWPAKALKFKDGMVDCRFFGAHGKAWVPLKDCYLYSKVLPQPVKVKRGSNLEDGIEEIEKHIKKLKDKYGVFVYVQPRIPYNPAEEEQQLRMMLPNYSPKATTSTKYLIHPDRIKGNIKPKALFNENTEAKTSPTEETPSKDPAKEATDDVESDDIKPDRKASDDTSSAAADVAGDDTSQVVEEKPSLEQIQSTVKPIVVATPEKAHSTDTDAEESDSSRSTVTSTKSIASETSKSETSKEPKRKLVSVKKIETINASVPEKAASAAPTVPRTVINIVTTSKNEGVVVASPVTTTASRPEPVTCQIIKPADVIETVRVLKLDDKSKQKSVISVKNFATMNKCDSLINDKPSPANSLLKKGISKPTPNVTMAVHDFNLDKVKDEPIDAETNNDIPELTVREVTPKIVPAKSLLSKNQDTGFRKRSVADEDIMEAKKSKNESNCRTVNITENVTLSLINNQATQSEQAKSRNTLPKQKLTKTFTLPRPAAETLPNDANVNGFAAKPVRIAPAPSVQTTKTLKITPTPSRACNGIPLNGTMPSRSNITVVHPPRAVVKSTPAQNGVGSILDECMAEFQCNFRKAFEETLDRIAGKGDLRAKNILLQKEIENMKRNHELVIDEIKRDYEVQIAELRAASIAQKKFDLASERLKFEQEKERAVKEAKSKQWCSNCQKSANYYCCWNTAYCDFECQKEHWNQHMHVCKNDVKKKAAESSENEPPRIMMQNDATNNYNMLNGYDKPNASYTFQNPNISTISRNNVTKMQMKNVGSNKNSPRPLLPRVTATVTCSPSILSTPVVTASFVDNSFQNGNTSAPLRSTMIGSVNVHPYIRQTQQFHK